MKSIDIKFPDETKKYVDMQCNKVLEDYTQCPELIPILTFLDKFRPQNILEIGSGLGRISVFLLKYFNWIDTNFFLLDGDSGDKQVAGMNWKLENKYYNSLGATKLFCEANQMKNFTIINAEKAYSLPRNTFDLCYSCKAIGFHWPINDYLDIISSSIKTGAYLFFELRSMRKDHYHNLDRHTRACKFTQMQLDKIMASTIYHLVEFYDPVVLLCKV